MTVDNLFVREFYVSLFVDRAVPGRPRLCSWSEQAVHRIFRCDTPKERKAMTDKYINLSIAKVKENPGKFIWIGLKNFVGVGETRDIHL